MQPLDTVALGQVVAVVADPLLGVRAEVTSATAGVAGLAWRGARGAGRGARGAGRGGRGASSENLVVLAKPDGATSWLQIHFK